MSNHQENNQVGFGEKSLSSYIIGFGLSLLLTSIAFYCVVGKIFTSNMTYIALSVLAITQLIVQSICFLQLNGKKKGQWSLLPFLFIILIAFLLVGGSLWIMYNLNYNMAH